MSNSIWKTPGRKPDKNSPIVFRNDIGVIYCALDPKSAFLMRPDHKWAYLHEVVAQADKAERLQKAVNTALISIGTAAIFDGEDAKKYAEAKIDLIKQLIKGK